METKKGPGVFVFKEQQAEAAKSALYSEHIKLVDKSRLAAFGGYLMPLWYSSISEEHKAVREAAGMFDCSHMGVLEFTGKDAEAFLNAVTTNDVRRLGDGNAQYSYILDAAGNVLDDIIVYRRAKEKFMVVVNASNEPKVKAYIKGLLAGKIVIDVEERAKRLKLKPAFRDMRDTKTAGDHRVDIAVQGPRSVDVISELIQNEQDKEKVKGLKSFTFVECAVDGVNCIVSRTGYTGAKVSLEIYVEPDKAAKLWSRIIEVGNKYGLKPCGLGARDSLRIEAGLPLYGHELAGQYGISPFQAGYGWAVKLQKEFFIGKNAMQREADGYSMEVIRMELAGEKGVRPVRQNDGVVKETGMCIGWVLSCAKAGDRQIALALCGKGEVREGEGIGVYYLARGKSGIESGKRQVVKKGERLEKDITGRVLSRFGRF